MMDDKNVINFTKHIMEQYGWEIEKKIRKQIADELQNHIKYPENDFENEFYKGILFSIKTITNKN
jgi:Mn-dependent DtxR family transcriptional regulator